MSIKEEIEKVKEIGLENITNLEGREKFRGELKKLSIEARDKIWEERQGIRLPLPPPPPDPIGRAIYDKIKCSQQPKGTCPICDALDIETFIERSICGQCKTPKETLKCSRILLDAVNKHMIGEIDDKQLEQIQKEVEKKFKINISGVTLDTGTGEVTKKD